MDVLLEKGLGVLAEGAVAVGRGIAGLVAGAAPVVEALSFSLKTTDALLRATTPSPSTLRLMGDLCYFHYYFSDPYYSSYRPTNSRDKIESFQNVKIMSGKDLQLEFDKNQQLIEKFTNELTTIIPKLRDRSKPPSKELIDEFEQKFLIVQGLTKRNQSIVEHCHNMLAKPEYRAEVEKAPTVMSIEAAKARENLLKDNAIKYNLIREKANKLPKLFQEQFTRLNEFKAEFDTLRRNTGLSSRMQSLAEQGGQGRSLTTPPADLSQEPKPEDSSKKGMFSQFKTDAIAAKTMSTQLKIDEVVAKKFLNEISDSGVKAVVAEDTLELISVDPKKLCAAAKTLVTKYKNDSIFDLQSPSAEAAFKILEEAGDAIKIGSVTFVDQGKSVTLEGDANIKKFISEQRQKLQGPPPEPPKPNSDPSASKPGHG